MKNVILSVVATLFAVSAFGEQTLQIIECKTIAQKDLKIITYYPSRADILIDGKAMLPDQGTLGFSRSGVYFKLGGVQFIQDNGKLTQTSSNTGKLQELSCRFSVPSSNKVDEL